MATNLKILTRDWIEFLKNNRIVSLKSDPATGKLSYKRRVSENDLLKFLQVKTDFSEEDIMGAINQVKTTVPSVASDKSANAKQQQSQSKDLSTWMHYGMSPGEAPPEEIGQDGSKNLPANVKPRQKRPVGDVSDVEDKRQKRLREDLDDRQRFTFSEDEVEKIFSILVSKEAQAANVPSAERQAQGHPGRKPIQPDPEQKINDLRKIKRLIRDDMTEQQRLSLWRLLTSSGSREINEEQISDADAKEILKTAHSLRNKQSWYNIFKKPTVEISDLQKSWRDTDFSDDTKDIRDILLRAGYSEKEITKVFSTVLGQSDTGDDYAKPTQTSAIIKIAKYIEKNGLKEDVVRFMASEYGYTTNESLETKKLVIEEIREIFQLIVNEERPNREALLRNNDFERLGRTRK